jgi:hypothetical protein
MSRFLAVAVAIGLLIAAKAAAAAQGYVFQGLVGATGTPGAASFEAMAAMPTGNLAVAYATPTGTSVIVFDNSGKQVKTLTFPKLKISGMVFDSYGRFVFLRNISINANYVEYFIQIFNTDGKLIASRQVGSFDVNFDSLGNLTAGSNNSIIFFDYSHGLSTCNSTMYVYDANLKLMSSSWPSSLCALGVAAMGGNLLVATTGTYLGFIDTRVVGYNGKTLGLFGNGQESGPVATSLGQVRAFSQLFSTKNGYGGIGVFNSAGKLLQSLPYPNLTSVTLPPNIAAISSTTANYFYIANPFPLSVIERFGPGTLPPLPVAKAVTANVQAGHSVPINVTASALHGPFDYVGVTRRPTMGDAQATSLSTITYFAHSAAQTKTDTFTYTVWNSSGSSTATVTVTIAPAPPVGVTLFVSTDKNGGVAVDVTQDAQNGPFTSVSVATPPAHGKAAPNGLEIFYTPNSGFAGPDSFTYKITNAAGTSAPATVNVFVR